MTKEKYLSLCEQMGEEPNENKCPPEFEDFPIPVQQAIEIYNRLGDRAYPEIGYLGKDFTSLPLHLKVLGVTEEDIVLETLIRLDSYMIKKSNDELKKAREAVKKKGNVKK